MKKVIYIVVCVFALFGCSGFLEEYSQDKAYIRSYEDLDEFMATIPGSTVFMKTWKGNKYGMTGRISDICIPI